MENSKLKVAIIGAGIGGLAFAVSLHKLCANVEVEIYEATATLTEIGAGVGIWPRDWEILEFLGLADDLRAIAGGGDPDTWPIFEYRKSDEPAGFTFVKAKNRVGFMPLHRAHFQRVLARHLPACVAMHFAKRLIAHAVLPGGMTELHFADGSTAQCDLLVGCDGIRSAVRAEMFRAIADSTAQVGDPAGAQRARAGMPPSWTGTVAYRALVPTDVLLRAHPGHSAATEAVVCFGKNKHVIWYPISHGQSVNVVAFVSIPELEGTVYDGPWVAPAKTEDIVQTFCTWDAEVKSLLGCADNALLWAINVVVDLPTYVHGNVVLVGDAAHAMAPHQGAGAGQAFEDGFILANLLAHPSITRTTLARALHAYDAVRRPFSQDVLQRARTQGMLYQLTAPGWEGVTVESSAAGKVSREKMEDTGRSIVALTEWQGLRNAIFEERDRALRLLD